MNVEIGTGAKQFLFWVYLFQILNIVSLQCRGEGLKLLLLSVTLKIPEIMQKRKPAQVSSAFIHTRCVPPTHFRKNKKSIENITKIIRSVDLIFVELVLEWAKVEEPVPESADGPGGQNIPA
jgi:hypothetical protein